MPGRNRPSGSAVFAQNAFKPFSTSSGVILAAGPSWAAAGTTAGASARTRSIIQEARMGDSRKTEDGPRPVALTITPRNHYRERLPMNTPSVRRCLIGLLALLAAPQVGAAQQG